MIMDNITDGTDGRLRRSCADALLRVLCSVFQFQMPNVELEVSEGDQGGGRIHFPIFPNFMIKPHRQLSGVVDR